jgi:DNA-binding NarL/FixJ family response regulator
VTKRRRSAADDGVTDRQLEVLHARCVSGSRKAAAYQLGLDLSTIHFHLQRLLERSGLTDDAQACWVYRRDLERLTTLTTSQ